MSKSMNNKQIRKNNPAYRRQIKSNNYICVFNSFTLDKNNGKFNKKFTYIFLGVDAFL